MNSRKFLIVNADDFGISESVSRGILFGHEFGVVSSTTAITNGRFFEEGARLLRSMPALGVGVHLNLDEETAALPPSKIPSLVDEEGRFYSRWTMISRLIRGTSLVSDVAAEWSAQIRRCLDFGISPSHLDSHGHIYHLPVLHALIGDLAVKFGINSVRRTTPQLGSLARNPGALMKSISLLACGIPFDRRPQLQKVAKVRAIGLEESGRCTHLDLVNHIRRLPPGVTEIMLHPGFNGPDNSVYEGWQYRWEQELQAITDIRVIEEIERNGVELVSHHDLVGLRYE